jgi:UDP-N-acetyl-D-galactosamine dehydrogenase
VPHQAYRHLSDEHLSALLNPGGTLADIKGIWRNRKLDPSIDRWSL